MAKRTVKAPLPSEYCFVAWFEGYVGYLKDHGGVPVDGAVSPFDLDRLQICVNQLKAYHGH